ncbi:MAG: trypsin-like peptidase domain-containing protein [Candidatus Vogelbacteria bacterium]|nr:trypsin-like peptidase domain-containing protein [Candidatus Vogelbacteria bacterium]
MRKNLILILTIVLTINVSPLKCLALSGETIYERNKRATCGIITTFVYEHIGAIGTYSVSGSGIFIKRGGYALIANHCLDLSKFIPDNPTVLKTTLEIAAVQQGDGRRIFEAKVVGVNAPADLAVIQAMGIKDSEYEVAEVGDSGTLRPGELVYGIGCPTGQDFFGSIWSTRVQFVNRQFGKNQVNYMIQLDYPGIPSASGSPIFNSSGKVIGILLMNFGEKMSFGRPINLAKLRLLLRGDVILPNIGIFVLDSDFPRYSSRTELKDNDLKVLGTYLPNVPTERLRRVALASVRNSAIVLEVDKEDLKGRFTAGDIILGIGSKLVREGMALKAHLLGRKVGTTITLKVLHTDTGKVTREKVTLTDK